MNRSVSIVYLTFIIGTLGNTGFYIGVASMGLRNSSRLTEIPVGNGIGLSFRSENRNYGKGNGRMEKFMLSLRAENYLALKQEAEDRGISVQELIRAVIIADWVRAYRRKD